ncbi:MAG: DNA polymerase III subunit chi [Hyphomicrobiales bacterium]|nr:DNA polymerase III subunit chi [Hyphomicrobiales bacterium]MCP5372545.1 DNA polymerase III subunit chi [Hyphomicrobiales bacterium]
MTEVSFYHLQRWPLERALPKLLEKTLQAGKRAVVMAASDERVEYLNGFLWTYDPNAWLPHGSRREGQPAEQPVWLTSADENPNGAAFLFLTDGAGSDRVADYERCFDLFDGNDAGAVQAARERWKACKDAGHELTYWQQTDRGGWERKA